VGGYGVDFSIPHFCGIFPGDTYYCMPLSMYCFGVLDVSSSPEDFHCYGYTEALGRKCGNVVASLIMLSLKRLGLINRGSRGMRLSIIMDSKYCQVHNGHVVQLALLLVELSYFQAVEFIFHIDGHGNYICDNTFKRLNKTYQDSNVFNMEVLFNLFNQLDNITYHNVAMESLYDYKQFLSRFYQNVAPETLEHNNFYQVEYSHPTTMCSMSYNNVSTNEVMKYDHLIEMNDQHNQLMNALENLTTLVVPGVLPMKQVQLWKSWGQLYP
jgi:hypothetical protein